ncbi:Uncharacterised protein [Mycobacteroides abscessus subsp. abscessus]|nr:Uncharacterised protein [Mycobacteroides abscessus subsp. abscessus]
MGQPVRGLIEFAVRHGLTIEGQRQCLRSALHLPREHRRNRRHRVRALFQHRLVAPRGQLGMLVVIEQVQRRQCPAGINAHDRPSRQLSAQPAEDNWSTSRYPHRRSTSHPAGTAILIELRCSQAVQPFDRHRNVDFVAVRHRRLHPARRFSGAPESMGIWWWNARHSGPEQAVGQRATPHFHRE